MATPNYSVNYNDKRFAEVEADKKAALNEIDVTYGNMINNSDKYYDKQIDAVENWGDKQAQIQQDNTDFAIEKIEQQKAQAQKDYTKEQSGAYVDWQKQSNEYGANAEAMAAQGMANSGYSESSQVSMYNTYQNRVATAREVFSRAVLEYDNAMKDARLQNNAALAEIAYQTLQKKLELSLEGFQYKNNLIIEQSNKKLEVENIYHQRYQDVLKQINQENALKEEVRQYEKNFAEERRQFNENYKLQTKEYEEGIRQFNEEIKRLKAKDAQENKSENQKQQLQEEQRQFNTQMAAENADDSGGGVGKIIKFDGNKTIKGSNSRGTGLAQVNAVNKDDTDRGIDAYGALNKMIASGVSKDKISNEIALALRNGAITKEEAQKLRSTFTPRGYTY